MTAIDNGKVDFAKQRMDECVPVAKKILEIMTSRMEETPIGDVKDEEKFTYYQKIYPEIAQLLLDTNVRMRDVSFIFSLAFQPLQMLQDVVTNSFTMNKNEADKSLWGKDGDEIRVKDVDETLKAKGVLVDKETLEGGKSTDEGEKEDVE